MAGKPQVELDTRNMTVGEQADFAAALGIKTAKQYEAKMTEIQRLYQEENDFEIGVLPAFIWVALKHGGHPDITLEEVRNLTDEEIQAMLPNARGGSSASSTPNTSRRSASRTTTRRNSSGR